MSEAERPLEPFEVGLLLETVQSQQRLAEATLTQLREQVQSLEMDVRTEVACAAREAFAGLSTAAEGIRTSLLTVQRTAGIRAVAWSAAAALASAAVAVATLRLLAPSQGQIDALRARRALFSADVRRLREYGGSVELRRCGSRGRLCVRVQRAGPAYGAHGDFLLVKAP